MKFSYTVPRFTRPSAAAMLTFALAEPLFAQGASLEYRVSFNGALGAPIVVADNGPLDSNLAPGDVDFVLLVPITNGVMTLDAGMTISGFKIPGVNGRNITVTAVHGHVNAGQFQANAGTIDIYACYRFLGPGFEVPSPNVFTRAITGSLVNAVDGMIDLAAVRYNAGVNTACAIGPGDPGAFVTAAGPMAAAPIPFFHAQTYGLAFVPAVDIGTVTRLTIFNNGDGVLLPGSAHAEVVEVNTPGGSFCSGDGSLPTPCPCVPPNTVPNPSGAPGHGCANSFNLDGAILNAYGTTVPDTITFNASIASNYVGFGFLLKGNNIDFNGIANGDGVLCVTGQLIRFGSHYAGTNGAAIGVWTYPNDVQTIPVSVITAQGPMSAEYQLIYRNAAANFCNASTLNWSNGVLLLWQ